MSYLFLYFLAVFLIISLFMRRKFSVGQIALFGVFFIISSYFLVKLGVHSYSNDSGGHLDYIRYIYDNFGLPAKKKCWTCYHSPLYFILAAIVNFLSSSLTSIGFEKKVQVLTYFISLGFIGYSLLVIRKFIKYKPDYYLVSAALIFMPSMTLNSVRIGNDSLFYLFTVMTMYYACSFLETHRRKLLVISALCALLSLTAKLTGFINLILILMLFLYTWFKSTAYTSRIKLKLIYLARSKLIICIFIIGIVFYIRETTLIGGIVGNSGNLGGWLGIQGNAYNFMYLDFLAFIKHSWVYSGTDPEGRQYFWNHFLKTALVGDWPHDGTWKVRAIAFLCLTWLMLIAYNIFYFFKSKAKDWDVRKVLLLSYIVAYIAAAIYISARYTYACSQNFRYVQPILIPFFIFTGICLTKLKKDKNYFSALFLYLTLGTFAVAGFAYNLSFFLK